MHGINRIIGVLGLSAVAANGAIVHYTLSGVTEFSSVTATGSFSYDTTVIGPNYSSVNALADLSTFTVTISSIPGTPTSTTFNKSSASSFFEMQLDGDGAIVNFAPGFDLNGDGYSLSPAAVNISTLEDLGFTVSEAITWTATQVPEVEATAIGMGLMLAGWVVLRKARRG